MAASKMRNILNNKKGQAMIELVIFLPFLFMFFSVLTTIGNAINGSINQQKVVRGYFYLNLQNNSKVFSLNRINPSWQSVGMYSIGWRERFASASGGETGEPLAPCYRLALPVTGNGEDTCEEEGNTESLFVKIETVYGVCSPTYVRSGDGIGVEESIDVASVGSCTIQ